MAISTANLDSASDSPANARAQLLEAVQWINATEVDANGSGADKIAGTVRVVATIAALRAVGSTGRQFVQVAGYHAAGDGGGGLYRLDTSDTTTADNGGTVIVSSAGGRWKLVYSGPVNVLWFGADRAGAADSTAAFNAATRATVAHAGNDDLSMRREILVPPGDYKILGTVYVRKGQTLRGSGDGVTRITTATTSTGRIIFKLGHGLISGAVTEDPGGLPPVIENLHIYGGDTSGGVVDMQVAGAQARDLFITSAGVGVRVGGGDTITTRCIIDQGLNGIVVSGQNHIINSCLFYNMNYALVVNGSTFDAQFSDCHFEYSIYNDIIFSDGATDIKNVSIADSQFVKNAQYGTSNAAINIRSNGAEIAIRGCDFRNQAGYSIARTNGIGNIVRVSDCTFNGLKTVPVYSQGATAAGIDTTNCAFEIISCRFENLNGPPVNVGHSFGYAVRVQGCTYRAISGPASFVSIGGSAGSVQILDCTGDNVLPLVNTQSGVSVSMRGNRNWLGSVGNSGGRYFVRIPTQGSAVAQVAVKASTNPAGNTSYRKATAALVGRHIDNTGAAVSDYSTLHKLHETPAGYAPAIDILVELDAVGGGAVGAYSAVGRNIVVSVPNTYQNVEFEADFVA